MTWALAFLGAALLLGLGVRRLALAASRRRARRSALKRALELQTAARTRRGLPRFGAGEE